MSYDRNMQIDVYAVYDDQSEKHLQTYVLDEIAEIANNTVAKKEGSTTPKLTL